MAIEFTWDAKKERINIRKHRVSFETAKQVFLDPCLVVIEDCEVGDELRYHAIGHTVSAREGNQYEQRTYADQFKERN